MDSDVTSRLPVWRHRARVVEPGARRLAVCAVIAVTLGALATAAGGDPHAASDLPDRGPGDPRSARVTLIIPELPPTPPGPPLTDALARARAAEADLIERGLIPAAREATAPTFVWPVRNTQPGSSVDDYWYSSNFVDHDPRLPGHVLDYAGGNRTYDLDTGYNHAGSDITPWPYGWARYALGNAFVVAAATGMIVERVDGAFSAVCNAVWTQARGGNLVTLRHDDGSLSIYVHLREGSITPKLRGERIEQGEYIGAVGSSGFSSHPHLHFEVHGPSNTVVDPFEGPFNDTIVASRWQRQPPYRNPRLLEVLTHSRIPVLGGCVNTERTHVSRSFAPGDSVFVAAYVRDLQGGQRIRFRATTPDGKTFERASHRATGGFRPAGVFLYRLALPQDAAPGRWTVHTKFRGPARKAEFEVGDGAAPFGVRTVRPRVLEIGATARVTIRGHGFPSGLVADMPSRALVDRGLRIVGTVVTERRIVVTVELRAGAVTGPRDLVLTAPDFTQVVFERALTVR